MKLSKRESIFLVVGLIVISVASYVFYFIMPQLDKQQSITSQLNSSNGTLQILMVKSNAIGQMNKDIAAMSTALDEKTINIPHGSNDTQILIYLKNLASQTDIDFNYIFTANPTLDGLFIQRSVILESVTSYEKLSAFLKELNKSELYNKVLVLSADYIPPILTDRVTQPGDTPPPDSKSSEYSLNAHIEIIFYAFPLKDAEPMPAPPLVPDLKDRQAELFPK